MRLTLVLVFVTATITGSPAVARDEANIPFSTLANNRNKMTIEWLVSTNVQRDCEKESHRRGFGGFGIALQACSFWTYDSIGGGNCTIITSKVTTMGTLGHETRHCFQGAFH
jgi:hypothetical protein